MDRRYFLGHAAACTAYDAGSEVIVQALLRVTALRHKAVETRVQHFYIDAPADETLAISTWLLFTAAASMTLSSSLTLR